MLGANCVGLLLRRRARPVGGVSACRSQGQKAPRKTWAPSARSEAQGPLQHAFAVPQQNRRAARDRRAPVFLASRELYQSGETKKKPRTQRCAPVFGKRLESEARDEVALPTSDKKTIEKWPKANATTRTWPRRPRHEEAHHQRRAAAAPRRSARPTTRTRATPARGEEEQESPRRARRRRTRSALRRGSWISRED